MPRGMGIVRLNRDGKKGCYIKEGRKGGRTSRQCQEGMGIVRLNRDGKKGCYIKEGRKGGSYMKEGRKFI
jgi:hypothetical protein